LQALETYGPDYAYIFPIIMVASRDIVTDPLLIEPGMKLTIPDLKENIDPKNRMQISFLLGDFSGIYSKKGDRRTGDRFFSLAMKLAAY
jgi:hypothetical protein